MALSAALQVLCAILLIGGLQEALVCANTCCLREPKMQDLDVGLSLKPLTVDVGRCLCADRSASNATNSSTKICNSKCYPRKVRMETYHRIRGPKDIEVITTCASSNIKRRCRRTRKTAVYFQGTRFEQNVDVGYCDGPCGEGTRCEAVETTKELILGPNGNVCVSVIKACRCVPSCYRLSYYQQYLEVTDVGDLWKTIDVGRCAGSCPGSTSSHLCVSWSPEDPSICDFSITAAGRVCAPTAIEATEFRTRRNKYITVHSIQLCGCGNN